MKRNSLLLIILLFVTASSVFAQKKELTIKDAVIGQYRSLYPERIYNIKWIGETSNYSYYNATDNNIKQGSVKSKKDKVILTTESLNEILKKAGKDEVKSLYQYSWINKDIIEFESAGKIFSVNLKTKKVDSYLVYNEKGENVTHCKENKAVAYTIENNLFITDKSGKEFAITSEDNKGIVSGQTVHRSEFGITGGIFWSPKGTSLAFYKKDETMVTDYPLVDVTARSAEVNNTKYPMAGMKSEEVKLGVYNLKSKKTIFLKTGEPKEQYLTNVSWSPDEKFIYISVLNRGQNHLKLNKYDANTGDFVKTLFEEKNDKYVEPEHHLAFLNNTTNNFIFFSERDGYNHMYLYNTDGKMLKQLTKGNWLVLDIIKISNDDKFIYFNATKDSPLETRAYKLNMTDGKITTISTQAGTHNLVKIGKNYIIDSYSSTKEPRVYNIVDKNGKVIKNLLTAENPLTEYDLGEMTISTIKTADKKTDLYYRLITPPNFDKSKKYPAIVYVYGGPHAQMITNSWLGGARMWLYYMAQKGYVIMTVDNRGSANRGFEFESIIHRNVGVNEIEDQMQGIELLKTLGYVDMNKIGADGWSYGGFMTTSLMLKHNDVFKVGVAGGPVIDWKYYEIMYGERYMDTPEENPDGYEENTLTNYVTDLKGKLMLIHGGIDPTVVWQHSLVFVNKCVKENVQVDYFVYPRHEHNVRGMDRIHLMQKVTNYFDDYLK